MTTSEYGLRTVPRRRVDLLPRANNGTKRANVIAGIFPASTSPESEVVTKATKLP